MARTLGDRHEKITVSGGDAPLKVKLPPNRGVFRLHVVGRNGAPLDGEPWKIVRAQTPAVVVASGTTSADGGIAPDGDFDVNDYLLRIADEHYLVPKRYPITPRPDDAPPVELVIVNRPDDKPCFSLLSPIYTHPRGGRDFLAATVDLPRVPDANRPELPNREQAILDEVLNVGNTPSWTEDWKEVRLTRAGTLDDVLGKVWVMPDYLAVGDDSDFVRLPVTGFLAQQIADAWGLCLPTERITAAVYEQADVRLVGRGITPSNVAEQLGLARTCHHNDLINGEIAHPRCQWHRDLRAKNPRHYAELWTDADVAANSIKGKNGTVGKQLIAGHKKDVMVLFNDGNDLVGQRSLCYGGLYDAAGNETQKFRDSPGGHTAGYADYSHAVRLVWPEMSIDGVLYPIKNVLRERRFVGLLTTSALAVPAGRSLAYPPRVPGAEYG